MVVAPPITYGSSGEHQSFSGTLSIGSRAIELVLVELARSATHTFDRVVFVSTHGGNAKAVGRAVRRLRDEGRDVRAWVPGDISAADAHAGWVETSLMLAAAPSSVRLARAAAGNVTPVHTLTGWLETSGVAAVSENGVLGDPAGASVEKHGTRLLRVAIEDLTAAVRAWRDVGREWL